MTFLHGINKQLAETYRTNMSLSNIVRDNLAFPYREKSIKILTSMLHSYTLDAIEQPSHTNQLLFEWLKMEQVMNEYLDLTNIKDKNKNYINNRKNAITTIIKLTGNGCNNLE